MPVTMSITERTPISRWTLDVTGLGNQADEVVKQQCHKSVSMPVWDSPCILSLRFECVAGISWCTDKVEKVPTRHQEN